MRGSGAKTTRGDLDERALAGFSRVRGACDAPERGGIPRTREASPRLSIAPPPEPAPDHVAVLFIVLTDLAFDVAPDGCGSAFALALDRCVERFLTHRLHRLSCAPIRALKGRLHLGQGTILVLLVDRLVDLVFRLELRHKLDWRLSRDPALDAS